MYFFTATSLAERLKEILDLAEIEEVVLTRDDGENLIMVKQSVWRGLQDLAHLLSSDINADRLVKSLREVRQEHLSKQAEQCASS
jgi:antitoxin YefM